MRVKFFANLRRITGVKELEIEAETVESLLEKLVERYGDEFRDAILEDGRLRRFIKILRNGRDIDFEEGLKTKLDKNDVIAIFPPAGGG